MFRRRTDQVYSTLQQVQRRITEQSGGSPTGDYTPTANVHLQPLAQALPSGGVPTTATSPNHTPSGRFVVSPPAPHPVLPPPSGKRYVLQISGELAMLLVVLWLMSLALMFVLGQQWRGHAGANHAGDAHAANTTSEPTRQGRWIMVLQSKPNSAASRKYYENWAAQNNVFAKQNVDKGWKPYFYVRDNPNGNVELAFGYVDGVWGLDKKSFETFADYLRSDSGGKFGSLVWVQLDP